jgi:hypothetical protein
LYLLLLALYPLSTCFLPVSTPSFYSFCPLPLRFLPAFYLLYALCTCFLLPFYPHFTHFLPANRSLPLLSTFPPTSHSLLIAFLSLLLSITFTYSTTTKSFLPARQSLVRISVHSFLISPFYSNFSPLSRITSPHHLLPVTHHLSPSPQHQFSPPNCHHSLHPRDTLKSGSAKREGGGATSQQASLVNQLRSQL